MKKLVLGALCLGVVLAGCGGGAKPPGAGDVAAVPEKVVMPDKLRISVDYIARANFVSDLQVIGSTLATVLRGRERRPPVQPHRPPAE